MTFDDIRTMATGFQPAKLLLTAMKMGVFEELSAAPLTAGELASKLGAHERTTRIACDALASLGLLAKAGEGYQNSEAAKAFLVKDSPSYRGFIILHMEATWADWNELEETWKAGTARASRKEGQIPKHEDELRNFILGMENMTRELAPKIAGLLRLKDKKAIIDIGAGPGNYALAFAQEAPGATVTHFDLAPTTAVAREFVAGKPNFERVQFLSGDFTADAFGGPYDFAWVSQVLHMLGDDEVEAMIQKVSGALVTGGQIAVHEHFLEADRASPASAAMFGAHMMAVTKNGRAYSFDEMEAWMAKAGLGNFQRIAYGGPSRILVAAKG